MVQVRDVVRREEGGADVTDETANAMDGKDVEGIVDTEDELELCCIVGEASAESTEDDCRPDWNVACWCLLVDRPVRYV